MTLIIAIGLAAAGAIVVGAAVGSTPLMIVVAATLAIPLVLAIPSSGRRSRNGEDDGNSDNDGGSRLDPRPRNPTGPTHAAQPEWWPQFEREFAAHVERDRRRRTTPASPA